MRTDAPAWIHVQKSNSSPGPPVSSQPPLKGGPPRRRAPFRARRLKLAPKAFKIRPARPGRAGRGGVASLRCNAWIALETVMGNIDGGLSALADHLQARRGDILQAWRHAIDKDPTLTTSESLPRVELYDHIPAL